MVASCIYNNMGQYYTVFVLFTSAKVFYAKRLGSILCQKVRTVHCQHKGTEFESRGRLVSKFQTKVE